MNSQLRMINVAMYPAKQAHAYVASVNPHLIQFDINNGTVESVKAFTAKQETHILVALVRGIVAQFASDHVHILSDTGQRVKHYCPTDSGERVG